MTFWQRIRQHAPVEDTCTIIRPTTLAQELSLFELPQPREHDTIVNNDTYGAGAPVDIDIERWIQEKANGDYRLFRMISGWDQELLSTKRLLRGTVSRKIENAFGNGNEAFYLVDIEDERPRQVPESYLLARYH